MSRVFQCDRCKTIFEPRVLQNGEPYIARKGNRDIDLCPKCYELLKNFLSDYVEDKQETENDGGEIFVKARKIAEELTKSIEMEHDKLEAQARWICCPMCDREKCNRNADDCDVKKWIKKKVKKGDE